MTVSVLFTVPLAGGVTEAGLKLQDTPAGRLAQDRLTALAKPPVEVTVQVLFAAVALLASLRLDGRRRC